MPSKFKFLTIVVLAVILAASSFSPVVVGNGGTLYVKKVTTNGDTTTLFHFDCSSPGGFTAACMLSSGNVAGWGLPGQADYTLKEAVPDGWVVSDISAVAENPQTTFTFFPGLGVIIHFAAGDTVTVTFTNCPVSVCPDPRKQAVGGVVLPTNVFTVLAPYFAVIGLVATAAVAVKKRRN